MFVLMLKVQLCYYLNTSFTYLNRTKHFLIPGVAICFIPVALSPQYKVNNDNKNITLPNVIVASRCALSSWKANTSCYDFQSKVDLGETQCNMEKSSLPTPIKMCLSPCNTGLVLSIGDNVHIFSVASNLGLAQCKCTYVKHQH